MAARRRRRVGLAALAPLAGAGLLAGVVIGALKTSEAERTAKRFAEAWAGRDYQAMYGLLTPAARARFDRRSFVRAYERASATATATAFTPDDVEEEGGGARVSMTVRTRVFGDVRADARLPVSEAGVDWAPHLAFPGVPPRTRLRRRTEAPPRAKILASSGQTIVEGPAAARRFPLGETGASIAGMLGPPATARERERAYARGFPPGAPVAQGGLERIFDREVAGRPGGTLRAGRQTLARTSPVAGRPVRTTIDPKVQRAAAAALSGRLGGVAALDARTAEVRALAGIAFSGPQPPGSTFKIVTTAAALERRLVAHSSRFSVETRAVIDGVELENAHGESCGGTFVESFAESCNSVFAPLGVRVGAERLVEVAERFGFNRRPAIAGAASSTLPKAGRIESALELGSTAIGQGRVLATALQVASLAQTVAAGGLRREPTLRAVRPPPAGVRVISPQVAAELERLMISVVEEGTGTSASLPVRVAGKTGTAELGGGSEGATDASGTDAWFTGYAPVGRPKLAACVLLVRAGAGGETAAPATRDVLEAGL